MNGNGAERALKLNASTIEVVEQLAQTWGVTREEAVRRAVQQANATAGSAQDRDRLAAFKALQDSLQLTSAKAADWQTEIRNGRR